MKEIKIKKSRVSCILAFVFSLLMCQVGLAQELQIPYPIIFIHGLTSNDTTWNVLIDFMKNQYGLTYGGRMDFCLNQDANTSTSNWKYDYKDYTNTGSSQPITKGDLYTVNFDVNYDGTPYVNSLINESNQSAVVKQGLAISDAIKHVLEITGSDKVILVGHSMGGLAAREYLQNPNLWYESNKNHHVAKLCTIGTPHGGSNLTSTNILHSVGLLTIDLSSEAVRDLRTSYQNDGNKGIYLFGGVEGNYYNLNFLPGQEIFYNNDVNCNGFDTNEEVIQGLNNKQKPNPDLAYSCIIGTGSLLGADGNVFETGDGVVSEYRANINNYLNVNAEVFPLQNSYSLLWHTQLTEQISAIMKALDEPDEKELAYEIGEKSTIKGIISMREYDSPEDVDLYKINLKTDGLLTINITASNYTGIEKINLMDQNDSILKSISDISETIDDQVTAGVYYLQITGIATDDGPDIPASYLFPYTIKTNFISAPPTILTTSPTSSLVFYDVVVNNNQNETIKLTNNGGTNILITKLEFTGDDKDQFSISPLPPLLIQAGTSQDLSVNFSPTSIGVKSASLLISNNTSALPTNTIAVKGVGTSQETKFLVCTPTNTYNFGDTKVNSSMSKTFTIQNTGSNAVSVSNLALEGTNPEAYSITSPSVTSFDLASGEINQITVEFLPSTIGVKNAQLAISNNSDNISPIYSIDLYGNGLENIYSGSSNIITLYEYWFDNNYANKVTTSVDPDQTAYLDAYLSTNGLLTGLHFFHLRYKDNKGIWSAMVSEAFYKLPPASANHIITAYEYWFDNNYSSKVVNNVTPIQTLTLTSGIQTDTLRTGLHNYHIRYKDDSGQWSSIVSEVFNKLPVSTISQHKITAYEYWFDNDYAGRIITSVEPNQLIMVCIAIISDTKMIVGYGVL